MSRASLRYLDVCAGISAATVAWAPLGWQAAAYSEVEPTARAILAHHYPSTPLHGDFTTIGGDEYGAVDLLVGGTPCQDFSIAGLRTGLAGDRGNLTLEFLRLADRTRPRWVVWENVPGVLSIDGGRAFGAILGALGQLGYGFAYRILDAQFFGVPQRRRRVFVVGYLGNWRRAAAVLFERQSLSGYPAPSRQAGQGNARPIASSAARGSGYSNDADTADNLISATVSSKWAKGSGGPAGDEHYNLVAAEMTATLPASSNETGGHRPPGYSAETAPTMLVAHALRGEGFDASEDGTGRGTPLVPVAFAHQAGGKQTRLGFDPSSETCGTLSTDQTPAIAFAQNSRDEVRLEGGTGQMTGALKVGGGKPGQSYPAILARHAVRRLTPRECERLQGFPDDYTLVPYRGRLMADGPRYMRLGNSMAVPVMAWIGGRIVIVDAIPDEAELALAVGGAR